MLEQTVSSVLPSRSIFNLSPMRILIVEDDPLIQFGLEQVLGGYPELELVGLVADGAEGVQRALQLKPDLVLMDITLPGMDGIAATQEIKAKMPSIGVVVLTSHTEKKEVISALKSGADAYCVKGSKIERLLMAFVAAFDGGIYLDPQIMLALVDNLKCPVDWTVFNQLSEREKDVLELIVQGKSNAEIASALHLSPNTVKTHVSNLMGKLTVEDRTQVAILALRSGLF